MGLLAETLRIIRKWVNQMASWPTPPNYGASLPCEEIISGVRAVQVSPSGNLRIAMASVSGRMPAIGVVSSDYASGSMVWFDQLSTIQAESGLLNFSGRIGKQVWVGRSGHLGVMSGGWMSGGFASGNVQQRVGIVLNSGGVRVNIDNNLVSGVGILGIL